MQNTSKYTAVCDLPAIPPEELKARSYHIRKHGILDQIQVDEHGNIIDGLIRKMIADELGIACPEKVHQGLSEEDKRALRRALNLARRHLTSEQKRELIAAQLADTPNWSDRRIAQALGVSHPPVAGVRRDMEATGKITSSQATEGLDGKSRRVKDRDQIADSEEDVRQVPQETSQLQDEEVESTSTPVSSFPPDARERTLLIQGTCPLAVYGLYEQGLDLVLSDCPYACIKRPYGYYTEADWLDLMRDTASACWGLLKPTGSMVFIMQPNSAKAGRLRTWHLEFTLWAAKEFGLVQDAYWFNTSPIPSGPGNSGFLRPAMKWCVWLGNPRCYRDQSRVLKEHYAPGRPRRGDDGRVSPSGRTRRTDRMDRTSEERSGPTPYNVMEVSTASGSPGSQDHPAVTPLAVADWWCRYLLPPGGVLLDPFVGSGTMLVAGLNNGASKVIGIDKEVKFLGICRDRLGLIEAA